MKRTNTSIFLFVFLIFSAGAVGGLALHQGRARREQSAQVVALHRAEEAWLQRKQDLYAAELGLTPDQLASLKPALDQSRSDFRALREKAAEDARRIMAEHYRAVRRVLTPEQREKFNQLVQDKAAASR
jgi:Spy/CpxP family protein refolding chaperone